MQSGAGGPNRCPTLFPLIESSFCSLLLARVELVGADFRAGVAAAWPVETQGLSSAVALPCRSRQDVACRGALLPKETQAL